MGAKGGMGGVHRMSEKSSLVATPAGLSSGTRICTNGRNSQPSTSTSPRSSPMRRQTERERWVWVP